MYDCIVMVENNWRMENCPDYGLLYCNVPFVCNDCIGAMSCSDVLM